MNRIMKEQGNLELYESSEIQELVGDVPKSLQKWGVYLVAAFLAGGLAWSYFFQYPEMLRGDMVIPPGESRGGRTEGLLFLPSVNIGEVRAGARVVVHTDAYPETTYGLLLGKVRRVHGVPNESGLYRVDVDFPNGLVSSQGKVFSHQLQLMGTGEVVLREARLMEMLLKPFQVLNKTTAR